MRGLIATVGQLKPKVCATIWPSGRARNEAFPPRVPSGLSRVGLIGCGNTLSNYSVCGSPLSVSFYKVFGGLGFKKLSFYKVFGGLGFKKLSFYKVFEGLGFKKLSFYKVFGGLNQQRSPGKGKKGGNEIRHRMQF